MGICRLRLIVLIISGDNVKRRSNDARHRALSQALLHLFPPSFTHCHHATLILFYLGNHPTVVRRATLRGVGAWSNTGSNGVESVPSRPSYSRLSNVHPRPCFRPSISTVPSLCTKALYNVTPKFY